MRHSNDAAVAASTSPTIGPFVLGRLQAHRCGENASQLPCGVFVVTTLLASLVVGWLVFAPNKAENILELSRARAARVFRRYWKKVCKVFISKLPQGSASQRKRPPPTNDSLSEYSTMPADGSWCSCWHDSNRGLPRIQRENAE